MWWGHHGFGFFPFFGFFVPLLVVFLIFRLFAFRRGYRRCDRWHDGRYEAEAILQRRLASGEIGEEEYRKLKGILSK